MREFLTGWKRRVGVLTLVLACVFMTGWFRSQSRFEYVNVPMGIVTYGVASFHGGLDFYRTTELDEVTALNSFEFKSEPLWTKPNDPFNGTPWSAGFEFEWRWDWAGFHVGEGRYSSRRDQDCMIPYWSVVVPLTALSAYLLLTKPPKSIQKKITEPISAEEK